MIDHCLSVQRAEDRGGAYRTYLADCLRMVSESTAMLARGTYMKARWSDLTNKKPQPEDTRTADEVKEHMKKVLGRLEVGADGSV